MVYSLSLIVKLLTGPRTKILRERMDEKDMAVYLFLFSIHDMVSEMMGVRARFFPLSSSRVRSLIIGL